MCALIYKFNHVTFLFSRVKLLYNTFYYVLIKNMTKSKFSLDASFVKPIRIILLKKSCVERRHKFLSQWPKGTLSPETLSYIFDWDKIEFLKIILSLCLVINFDGDKIPIIIYFWWGQDRIFENNLVSMLSKYFGWRQNPHYHIFLMGTS